MNTSYLQHTPFTITHLQQLRILYIFKKRRINPPTVVRVVLILFEIIEADVTRYIKQRIARFCGIKQTPLCPQFTHAHILDACYMTSNFFVLHYLVIKEIYNTLSVWVLPVKVWVVVLFDNFLSPFLTSEDIIFPWWLIHLRPYDTHQIIVSRNAVHTHRDSSVRSNHRTAILPFEFYLESL